MIKTLKKLEIEGNFLDLTKDIYKNPTFSIISNVERLHECFLPKIKDKRGCSFLTFLCRIIAEVLVRASRRGKLIKGIEIEKGKVNLSLFTDNLTSYKENSKESMKN